MANNINDVIAVEEIEARINKVIVAIEKLEGKITEANEKTLAVQIDAKGLETLSELVAATKQQQQAAQDLTAAYNAQKPALEGVFTIQENYTSSLADNALKLALMKKELKETDATLKQYTSTNDLAIEKSSYLQQQISDLTLKQQELKIAIGQTTIGIKSEIKEMVAAKGSIDEMTQSLGQMRERFRAMSEAERENAQIGGVLNTQIGEMDLKVKQLNASIGNFQGNVGNYASGFKSVGAELSHVKEQMRLLALSGQKNSVEFRTLTERGQELQKAMTAVGRETKEALFSIEHVTNRVATMMFRVALHMIVFTVIIGAVTKLVEWFGKLSDAQERAKESLDSYIASTKELAKTIDDLPFVEKSKIAKDIFKAERLIDYINGVKNIKTQLEGAYKAYQDISSIAPGILDQFKNKEAFSKAFGGDRMKEQFANALEYIKLNDKIQVKEEAINKTIEERDKTLQQIMSMQEEKRRLANDVDLETDAGGNIFNYAAQKIKRNAERKANDENIKNLKENFKKQASAVIEENIKLAALQAQLFDKYGKTKDEKEKKIKAPNEKGYLADIEAANAKFAKEMEAYKAKFIEQKTLAEKAGAGNEAIAMHEKELRNNEYNAIYNHYAKLTEIEAKWIGKDGQLKEKHLANISKYEGELAKALNQNNEAEAKAAQDKINRELALMKLQDEAAEHAREHMAKMLQLEREAAAAKASAKISHEASQGITPFLSALGFDGDYKEQQKQFELQKQAKAAEIKDKENQLNAETHRAGNTIEGMPDPAKIAKYTEEKGKLEQDARDLQYAQEKAHDDRLIEAKKRIGEETIELVKQTAASIKQIEDQKFAAEQQRLTYEMERTQLQSKQKIEAIDATAGFQITKDNQKAVVAAQTAAKENEIQQKQNQLALKKAISDKKAAEMGILVNTALAEIKVIATAPNFVIGAAEAVLVAAIGAAQYAAAANAPLPQFLDGGDVMTPLFTAAEDGRRELGKTPQGDTLLFDRPGVYTAPIGTEIFNNAESERMIRYAVNNMGVLEVQKVEAQVNQWNDKNIVEELKEINSNLIYSVMAKPQKPTVIVINQANYLQRPNKR